MILVLKLQFWGLVQIVGKQRPSHSPLALGTSLAGHHNILMITVHAVQKPDPSHPSCISGLSLSWAPRG